MNNLENLIEALERQRADLKEAQDQLPLLQKRDKEIVSRIIEIDGEMRSATTALQFVRVAELNEEHARLNEARRQLSFRHENLSNAIEQKQGTVRSTETHIASILSEVASAQARSAAKDVRLREIEEERARLLQENENDADTAVEIRRLSRLLPNGGLDLVRRYLAPSFAMRLRVNSETGELEPTAYADTLAPELSPYANNDKNQ